MAEYEINQVGGRIPQILLALLLAIAIIAVGIFAVCCVCQLILSLEKEETHDQ